jgi:hypothetical protein
MRLKIAAIKTFVLVIEANYSTIGRAMIRNFKGLLLAMLMTTLVIAPGCQNDKPRLADEEVLEASDPEKNEVADEVLDVEDNDDDKDDDADSD